MNITHTQQISLTEEETNHKIITGATMRSIKQGEQHS